jgi:hypothetical protein
MISSSQLATMAEQMKGCMTMFVKLAVQWNDEYASLRALSVVVQCSYTATYVIVALHTL